MVVWHVAGVVRRVVRTAGQACAVPADPQRGPDPMAPAAGRLVASLRRRPLTARRAALMIASYTMVVTVAGGLIASLTDRKDFSSFGEGLWWALQTVTTVGYGDVVPTSAVSRVIGGFVMVSGIAFLTVIT